MKRRNLIALGPQECREFLEQARTGVLSTIDPRGYPHAVAMWFVMDDGAVLMTTYAKSQKAMNLRRNARAAFLAETGTTYDTLKGVLIRGRGELISDADLCVHVLKRIHGKMTGAFPEGIEEALRAQALKRVVIKVVPERISSWDHSKLGGTY